MRSGGPAIRHCPRGRLTCVALVEDAVLETEARRSDLLGLSPPLDELRCPYMRIERMTLWRDSVDCQPSHEQIAGGAYSLGAAAWPTSPR